MGSEEPTDHMVLVTPSSFPGFQSLYFQEELQVSKNSRREGGAVNLSWPLSHELARLVRLREWPQWMPLPAPFSAHHPTALSSSPVKIPYESGKLWDGSFNTRTAYAALIPLKALWEPTLFLQTQRAWGSLLDEKRKALKFADSTFSVSLRILETLLSHTGLQVCWTLPILSF